MGKGLERDARQAGGKMPRMPFLIMTSLEPSILLVRPMAVEVP